MVERPASPDDTVDMGERGAEGLYTAPPGWTPLAEAAEALGVDRRTVLRWCEAGRFRGAIRERVGSARGWRWLIPESEVDRMAGEGADGADV